MKRFAAVALISFAAWATVATAAPPRAALRSFGCQRALDPAARALSVQAVMRPLSGTQKLSLRFQLLRRRGTAPFTIVRAGDLGAWIRPHDPTLGRLPGDVWEINKPVANLAVAPATYRFRVTFRWTGAHGRTLGTAVRYSADCWQPELRPDLAVESITVSAISGQPSQDRYVALIRNGGATAAGPFEVLFSPADSMTLQTRTVQRLGANRSVRKVFVGPLCTANSAPTITVDPAGLVDDFNRSNNSLLTTCPSPGGP